MERYCIIIIRHILNKLYQFKKKIAYGTSGNANMGNHGWNSLNSEMQAVFLAQGPSFKRNVQVPPFYNIELYNLMCAMIDVTPEPNNGTWVQYKYIQ